MMKSSKKSLGLNGITWRYCITVNQDKRKQSFGVNLMWQTIWGGNPNENLLVGTHSDVAPCTQVLENMQKLFSKMLQKKIMDVDLLQQVVTSESACMNTKKASLDFIIQIGCTLGQEEKASEEKMR